MATLRAAGPIGSPIRGGDQALFVDAALFRGIADHAAISLMNDVELSARLRRIARPAWLRARVPTSGRRRERRGVWRTVWPMWRLRWRYWHGEAPEAPARACR